jgi:uncharacterized protein YecT (DUF1311 family)
MRVIPLLLLLSSTIALADAPECDEGSVGSILECLQQKHEALDSELNALYKEAIRRLPFADLSDADKIKAKSALVSAQRAWIRFRDEDCIATAVVNGGGDASKYESAGCENDHIRQRINDLNRYIAYLPERPRR